ncbi:MAG: PEGA domain-containing protein [Myxococcota bacterium]
MKLIYAAGSFVGLVMSAMLLVGTAVADEQVQEKDTMRGGSSESPWHQGVNESDKKRAQRVFKQGVKLHKQLFFAQAAEKYREALEYWEHPDILFYLGRALIRMGDPLEAHKTLGRAMRWGEQSLEPSDYRRARKLRNELEAQLSTLEVQGDQPGAAVSVDGVVWVVAPGSKRQVIRPGEHVIRARNKGYVAITEPVTLGPGQRLTATVELASEDGGERSGRPLPAWLPWAVLGGGVITSAVGGFWAQQSIDGFDEFDRQWAEACPTGCVGEEPQDLLDDRDRANGQRHLAIGAWVVGGTALAAGLTMLILNRPSGDAPVSPERSRVRITPLASGDQAGLSARVTF